MEAGAASGSVAFGSACTSSLTSSSTSSSTVRTGPDCPTATQGAGADEDGLEALLKSSLREVALSSTSAVEASSIASATLSGGSPSERGRKELGGTTGPAAVELGADHPSTVSLEPGPER